MKRLCMLLAIALVAVVAVPTTSAAPKPSPTAYVVEVGDTWSRIASKLGLPAKTLMVANGATSATTLLPGRILFYLPADLTTTTTTTIAAPPTTVRPSTTTTVNPGTTTTTTVKPSTTTTTVPPTTTVKPTTTTTTTVKPSTTIAPAPTTTAAPAATVAPTTSATPVPTTTVPVPGSAFRATFGTAADFYDRFDTQTWHRNLSPNNGNGLAFPGGHDFNGVWHGDHDMNCGAPSTQREIHAGHRPSDAAGGYEATFDPEAFWWCAPGNDSAKGHIMTAMGTIDDYSIVAFSPKQSFANLKRVCWSVNLTFEGQRNWPEVDIIPEADYQAAGGSLAWHSSEAHVYGPGAVAWLQQDGVARGFLRGEGFNWNGETFNTSVDVATRYPHCLIDNGNGTLTFTQSRVDNQGRPMSITATRPGVFPANARVIFSQHIYNAAKDGTSNSLSWHWDDIAIDVG